jgi:hypothetical protein
VPPCPGSHSSGVTPLLAKPVSMKAVPPSTVFRVSTLCVVLITKVSFPNASGSVSTSSAFVSTAAGVSSGPM